MIRAVYLDFYSIFAPDYFNHYLQLAKRQDPALVPLIQNSLNQYYLGIADIESVINSIRFKLNLELDPKDYVISEERLSKRVMPFIRGMHAKFLKVGIFANVGRQDYDLLNLLNQKYQLFEAIICPISTGNDLLTEDSIVKALQAIGEPPQSCLIVSGHEEVVAFAKKMGCQAKLFWDFNDLEETIATLTEN